LSLVGDPIIVGRLEHLWSAEITKILTILINVNFLVGRKWWVFLEGGERDFILFELVSQKESIYIF